MATESFSVLLPNLFVGLSKRSRYLKPYSEEFFALGYVPFKFEGAYQIDRGTINPDLIMISSVTGNTLIIEWSEGTQINERKQKQWDRYIHISTDDVATIMAVPVEAAQSFDVTCIVSTQGTQVYAEHFSQNNLNMPMLVFDCKSKEYRLNLTNNSFKASGLNSFFAKTIHFERIPHRYLQFPLDGQLKKVVVVPMVVRHLIALLAREESEFTLDDFCAGYIPIWRMIDSHKQRNIRSATRCVLADIATNKVGKQLIKRGSPPSWEITGVQFFKEKFRAVKTALNEFVVKESGQPFQESLFQDEE